jgi:hypothetical protein
LHNVNSDTDVADDPGSARFRPVQPRSILKRAVKPALRSGVAIICAASIAVNTVVVKGYAQSPPGQGPNTTYTSLTDGSGDVPVAPSF